MITHVETGIIGISGPRTRPEVNNDAVTGVFDVIYLIATAFSGGPMPVDPC